MKQGFIGDLAGNMEPGGKAALMPPRSCLIYYYNNSYANKMKR